MASEEAAQRLMRHTAFFLRGQLAMLPEQALHLWRVDYYTVESDDDLDRVPLAFERAEKTSQPVAVLIGTEYAKE